LTPAPWNAGFAEVDPLLAPIAGAARAFASERDWPAVADWNARLAAVGWSSPVEFVTQLAPLRRRGVTRAPYDAEVSRRGRVPSRERCWHDFLNMLVWATFPRTKAAIHARQLEAADAREPVREDARAAALNRGRERDALSMLDEGGVLVVVGADLRRDLESALADRDLVRVAQLHEAGRCEALVFGHALHEHLVAGHDRALFAAALVVPLASSPRSAGREAIDAAASACVADPEQLRSPRTMARLPLEWLRSTASAHSGMRTSSAG
jgi:hypothetical protein